MTKRSLSLFQLEILQQARSDELSFAWIESVAKDMFEDDNAMNRLRLACDEVVDLAESGLVVLGCMDFENPEGGLHEVVPYPVPRTRLRRHMHELVERQIQQNASRGFLFTIEDDDVNPWLQLTETGLWVSSEYYR